MWKSMRPSSFMGVSCGRSRTLHKERALTIMRGLFVSLVGTAAIAPPMQVPLHGLGQRAGLSLERVRDADRGVCQDPTTCLVGRAVGSA
jgi:hypothetical protein